MSDQTHKDRVKEAKKKRREYVWDNSTAWIGLMSGGLLCFVFGVLLIEILPLAFTDGIDGHLRSIIFLVASLFVALMYLGIRAFYSGFKEKEALPYVPPVDEQIAAFPAEEILLRGSDQPTSTPEELLRAIQAGTFEPKEELLRAEQERPGEQPPDTAQVQQTRL